MKAVSVALIAIFAFFVGQVEARQHTKTKQATSQQLTFQDEGQLLIRNCQLIKAEIAECFAQAGAPNSSSCQSTIKYAISNYLQSVGTVAALQLLLELQASDFEGFV